MVSGSSIGIPSELGFCAKAAAAASAPNTTGTMRFFPGILRFLSLECETQPLPQKGSYLKILEIEVGNIAMESEHSHRTRCGIADFAPQGRGAEIH
jgi:hypothetical protein